jgi:hypothetical protein
MRTYVRQHSRFKLQRNVKIKTVGGIKVPAISDNISLGGLGITCDQITARTIFPFGFKVLPDKPTRLNIEMSLDTETQDLQALCSVQNLHRLAQDAFGLNLKFVSFSGDSEELLSEFISQQNEAHGDKP